MILLGSCNVGKTSIINKYVKGVFYEKPTTTVGVDFATKAISKDELKSRSTSTCSDFFFKQQQLADNQDKFDNKNSIMLDKS